MLDLVPLEPPTSRASRYGRDIDFSDLNNAHTLGVLLVPPGSRVLDIGAADGSVARLLSERGCEVIGVESDATAAQEATHHCSEVLCADVETLDLADALGARRFDVVMLLDVLEHLRNPRELLERVSRLLEPHGVIIASIPNVTHASVRIHLLHGHFTRTETGLLDRTHLHFFDRPGIEQLFATARLHIHDVIRVRRRIEQTELSIDPTAEAPDVLRVATADLDSETYQFILVASRRRTAGSASRAMMLPGRLQDRVHSMEKAYRDLEDYARKLERTVTEREGRLTEREGQLAERDALLAVGNGELVECREQLAESNRQLAERNERLAERSLQLAERDAEIDVRSLRTDDLERTVRHLELTVERSNSSAARKIREVEDRLECVQQAHADVLAEAGLVQATTAGEARRATLQIAELRTSLAHAEQDTREVRETLSEVRGVLQARDATIVEMDARLQADAIRQREQQMESHRAATFLRRDVEVKDAYIAALRARERELEQAFAHADARARELEAEAPRLREVEAAARRVPTTPRYWLADRLNLALKKAPFVHRMLRATFVRMARIERSV